MKKIKQIVDQIVTLAEPTNPVIYDLSKELQDILKDNTIYTHTEVIDILNRIEGIERDEE